MPLATSCMENVERGHEKFLPYYFPIYMCTAPSNIIYISTYEYIHEAIPLTCPNLPYPPKMFYLSFLQSCIRHQYSKTSTSKMRLTNLVIAVLFLLKTTTSSIAPSKSLTKHLKTSQNDNDNKKLSRHRRFLVPTSGSYLNFFITLGVPITDAVWPVIVDYPYTILLDDFS